MKKKKNSKQHLNHKSKVDKSLDGYEDIVLFPEKYEKAKQILASVRLPFKPKRNIAV